MKDKIKQIASIIKELDKQFGYCDHKGRSNEAVFRRWALSGWLHLSNQPKMKDKIKQIASIIKELDKQFGYCDHKGRSNEAVFRRWALCELLRSSGKLPLETIAHIMSEATKRSTPFKHTTVMHALKMSDLMMSMNNERYLMLFNASKRLYDESNDAS